MKRLKGAFFLFVFIQGIFYFLLIPPWQSPDETRHFGYRASLSKDTELRPTASENLDKKIIESMDTFNAWKYQNISRPCPLPDRLDDVPFFGQALDVRARAPLYYQISYFLTGKSKINELITQFYLNRIFSLILYILSVYFTYLSARILFKDNLLYCLAAVSFVAFLPQFLIISTSINPINLTVLLETVIIYLMLLSLNNRKKLLIILFLPLIIGIGFFNHRSALFMVPPFLVLLFLYFIQSLKNKRKLLKILLISSITILLFLALYTIANHFFPSVSEVVISDSSIKARISEIKGFVKYLFAPESKPVANFFDGFFQSFWYFSGWMRFCYHPDIYSILKLISLLSLLGLFKYLIFTLSRKNHKTFINFKSFLILSVAGLSILLGTIIKYLPIRPLEVAQGRFIFPAISALAILFVLGLKEISPRRLGKQLPIFIIVGFIVLDIYTIFNYLISVFYYFTNN